MRKKIIAASLIVIFIAFLWIILPPYLRNAIKHGYANIDDYKIFPNKIVIASNAHPWPLSTNYNQKPIPAPYANWLKHYKTVAFVVVKNGQLIHESYYNQYNAHSIFNSFSMAKSIVYLLVGCAIHDNLITNLDTPVGNYFPPFNKPQYQSLKITHLLTMSSGLNWNETYSSPFSITTQAYYGDNLYPLVASLKIIEKPGVYFRYLSCNTQILSYVLQSITGKTVTQYATEKLWIPLQANSNALWSTDHPAGDEKAYCCFFATATDFARLGQMVLNRGKWNGQQIIDSMYLAQATQPASWLLDPKTNKPLTYYGYHFWLLPYKNQNAIIFQGLAGQYIIVLPADNLVIVRLGEKRCYFKTNGIPCDIYIWLSLAYFLSQ